MSKSNYLENAILNLVLGGTAFSAPANVHVGLFTTDPGEAGAGTEVSGNNYSRAQVTNNATNWPNATVGSKSNANAINFATPSGSWGTVSHFGIFDAGAAGNLLYKGALGAPVAIGTGNTVSISAGGLVITED